MKYSPNNWTHYLYITSFSDGCFYTGVSKYRGSDPENDGYYGSPKRKNVLEKIAREIKCKEVIAYLWCSSQEEAYDVESEWQVANFEITNPLCLNGHFGCTNFKHSSCVESGKKQGKSNVENGNMAKAQAASIEINRRPVVLYNPSAAEEIAFESVGEASNYLECTYSNLVKHLTGKSGSCKGHYARYSDGAYQVDVTKKVRTVNRPFKLKHIKTGRVENFSSIGDAVKLVKGSPSNLASLLRGERKSWMGYKFYEYM